jgi:hypothetical protein
MPPGPKSGQSPSQGAVGVPVVEGAPVSSRSDRKEVLGVAVSAQVLAFIAVVLILTGGVGFAVLRWLQSTT